MKCDARAVTCAGAEHACSDRKQRRGALLLVGGSVPGCVFDERFT